jgi:hypothetical protein
MKHLAKIFASGLVFGVAMTVGQKTTLRVYRVPFKLRLVKEDVR